MDSENIFLGDKSSQAHARRWAEMEWGSDIAEEFVDWLCGLHPEDQARIHRIGYITSGARELFESTPVFKENR